MADPNAETPTGRSGRRRGRRQRNQRRKRWALLLLLLASLVGAGVFAPDLIQFARDGQPGLRQAKRPVRTARPLVRHQWRFDFSMGPILELIEQGLNLEPFDLRRPLRIPFGIGSRGPDGDILLFEPAGYLPPLVPSNGSPLPSLPQGRSAILPPMTGIPGPGGGLPGCEPQCDPNLNITDDPLAPPGTPPVEVFEEPEPVPPVPEPVGGILLASGLLAMALLRRRVR